jgi:methyl-accepting chemotaxis protein
MKKATKLVFVPNAVRSNIVAPIVIPLAVLYFLSLSSLDRHQVMVLLLSALWGAPLFYGLYLVGVWISLSPVARAVEQCLAGAEISASQRTLAERRCLLFPYFVMLDAILAFSGGGALLSWILVRWTGLERGAGFYFFASSMTSGALAGLLGFFLAKAPMRKLLEIILGGSKAGGEKPAVFIPLAFKLGLLLSAILVMILFFLALLADSSFTRINESQTRLLQSRGLVTFKAVVETFGSDPSNLTSLIEKTSSTDRFYCLADSRLQLKFCPKSMPDNDTLAKLSALAPGQTLVSKSGWTWVWTDIHNSPDRIISGWQIPKSNLLSSVRGNFLATALVILLIGAVLVTFLAIDISRPLRQLSRTASQIAAGGQASRLYLGNEDETGILTRSFNRMTGVILAQLQSELDRGKIVLDNVRKAVNTLAPMSQQLMSISADQFSSAHEQAASIQQVAATSKEIAATSTRIAQGSESVTQVAEKTSESSRQGRSFMGEVTAGMEQIKKRVETVSSRILELGEQSRQISGVIDIINEISEQTNMLALNASIEAAGAGETGRRFSVVAGEVRRLAQNTLNATRMVRERVESIQKLTNSAVLLSEEEIKTVEAGFSVVREMGGRFGEISRMVDETFQAATEIKLSTQQQKSASEQMAQTLSEIAQVVGDSEKDAREAEQAMDELKRVIQELSSLIS